MYLKIFLCSFAIVVTSANNVIPAQTYPIYQQNGYMNPQLSQANSIKPYLQGVTAQNQMQQMNLSPSTIKQALLNRLLTSQPMQTISDPNARSYGSNLNGAYNNNIPVNLANNYVVVPRDYLKNSTSYANIDTKTNGNNTKKSRQGNKRRTKVRRQNDVETIEVNPVQKQIKIRNNTNTLEKSPENSKPSRKDTQKQNSQATETKKHTSDKESLNEYKDRNINESKTNRNERRKKKQQDQTTETPIKEETDIQRPKSPKRRKKQKENENIEPENQVVSKPKPKEIEHVDLDITKDGMNNENRLVRNSKQDANDLEKSIPNKPKEIKNNLIPNLNQFNNPLMGNWFSNFDNIYQSLANQPTVNETKPKRRRKSKKNRKTKRKNARNKNISQTTSVVNATKTSTDSITTEKVIYIKEKTQTNLNPNPTEESLKSLESGDFSSNEIFRDGYNINEFEDKYNAGYYEGYVDDYYPLFTDSAAYTANNKEIILKSLNDNKYYYSTDIIDTDVTQKRHKHNDEQSSRMLKDFEKNKHTYDEVEKESIRNAYKKEFDDKIEEKVQFRSPPHLELPDFRTRQVDRSELRPEVYYFYDDVNNFGEDKASSYSNAKTPYNSGVNRNEIKMQPKDVETVYARSKVVSYGPVYTPPEDNSSAATSEIPWPDHSLTSNSYKSGETTYVVAKSLDDLETYW